MKKELVRASLGRQSNPSGDYGSILLRETKNNISRNFLLLAAAYLLVGMALGSYMGGSGNHMLTPVHAHINLLGFTLMAVFSAIYKIYPSMTESSLARYHFWLHQAGTMVLIIALFLMTAEIVAAETIGPVFPISELFLILGTAVFGWNAYKNAA